MSTDGSTTVVAHHEPPTLRVTRPGFPSLPTFSVIGIFDGHGGALAAQFLQEKFIPRLAERMPDPDRMPRKDTEPEDAAPFLFQIRQALTTALAACETDFARLGQRSGATCSVLLLTGDFVTIACIGDSTVWMDSGAEVMRLTPDHGPGVNNAEFKRLEALGTKLARLHKSMLRPAEPHEQGFGPLRIYPGGLALSRAFGDLAFDIDPAVLSAPHITQLAYPPGGLRLLIASDGVWNSWKSDDETAGFIRNLRKSDARQAVNQALTETCYNTGLKDDATMAVLDVLSPLHASFPLLAKSLATKTAKSNLSNHGAPPTNSLRTGKCLVLSQTEIRDVVDLGSADPEHPWAPQTAPDQALSRLLLQSKERCRQMWAEAEPSASPMREPLPTALALAQQKELGDTTILEPSVHAPTRAAYCPSPPPGPASPAPAPTGPAKSRLSNVSKSVAGDGDPRSISLIATAGAAGDADAEDEPPILLLADLPIHPDDSPSDGLLAAAAAKAESPRPAVVVQRPPRASEEMRLGSWGTRAKDTCSLPLAELEAIARLNGAN